VNTTKTDGTGTGRIRSAAANDDGERADEQGDHSMVRTGRLRSAAMACGGRVIGTVIGTVAIALAVIGMAGPAGWARPAAARGDQAAPPGDESTAPAAPAPPAGTRPSSGADGSGSGPVGDLPGAVSDGLPVATGALAVAAAGAAVVVVRRSPGH
jgi:hypothetical protein